MPVIEDAAQAIGSRIGDRQAGTFGVSACFSFFPSKNLGAFGDAGPRHDATTPSWRAQLRLLRNHGAEPQYFHRIVGGNFRIDALQAAVLRVKAPYLAGWTEAASRERRSRIGQLFAEAALDGLCRCPSEPPGCRHIYNQFVIRVPERDRVRGTRRAAASARDLLPGPVPPAGVLRGPRLRGGEFPHAEAAARETLALPIYPELTEAQQAAVVLGARPARCTVARGAAAPRA